MSILVHLPLIGAILPNAAGRVQPISIPQGQDTAFDLSLFAANGAALNLTGGAVICNVRKLSSGSPNAGDLVISRQATIGSPPSAGLAELDIVMADTTLLTPTDQYAYDVWFVDSLGNRSRVIAISPFSLGERVTDTTAPVTVPSGSPPLAQGPQGAQGIQGIPGPLGGSGSVSQISFWTDSTHVSGDSALKFDATNKLVGVNLTPTAALSVAPVISSTVVGLLKGASGQTANLLELQDSAGTKKSLFDASGRLGIRSTSTLGALVDLFPSTSDIGLRLKFAQSASNNVLEVKKYDDTLISGITSVGKWFYGGADTGAALQINISTSDTGIAIRGITGQPSNYISILDNLSAGVLTIDQNGNAAFGGTAASSRVQINTADGSRIGLIVNAHANDQTSDLIRLYDGLGNILSRFDAVGLLGINVAPSAAMIQANTSSTSKKGLVIKLSANQTANGIEVQDSTGAVLFSVDKSGICSAAGFALL